jgi:hypothetical protein
MPSVREAAFELFRAHGMTTISTSAPAVGSDSGSRPPSGFSSPSPRVLWCASSGRAPPSTESPPCLDTAAVARAYGMPARDVSSRAELTDALCEAIGTTDGPRLVQAPVASGMWME